MALLEIGAVALVFAQDARVDQALLQLGVAVCAGLTNVDPHEATGAAFALFELVADAAVSARHAAG